MKEIKLTSGMSTVVDDSDYEWLSRYKWSFDRYAYRTKQLPNGRKRSERMHRLIMNPPVGMVVDHINGDKLDNRRENLRVVSQSVNARNIHNPKTKKVPAPQCVTWDEFRSKWKAQICVNYKKIWVGRFSTKEEAESAVNEALREVMP